MMKNCYTYNNKVSWNLNTLFNTNISHQYYSTYNKSIKTNQSWKLKKLFTVNHWIKKLTYSTASECAANDSLKVTPDNVSSNKYEVSIEYLWEGESRPKVFSVVLRIYIIYH